jgi:hypothetical protein
MFIAFVVGVLPLPSRKQFRDAALMKMFQISVDHPTI